MKPKPVQPITVRDIISIGKEQRVSLKQGEQVIISEKPKIIITNEKTTNKQTQLIFDLGDNFVPFLFKKDSYSTNFIPLDKIADNQFQGTFGRNDIIHILEVGPGKTELPVCTVKVVGLRANGSNTLEYSLHKWEGLLIDSEKPPDEKK